MLQDLASVATALGVIATAIGIFYTRSWLKHTQLQGVTSFEDGLNREYRELTRAIHPNVLLDDANNLTEEQYIASFPALYHYLDLCNEQVFLRQQGRISDATWMSWRDGIQSNLHRQAFARAWADVQDRSTNFTELRWLEQTQFAHDPRGVSLQNMEEIVNAPRPSRD